MLEAFMVLGDGNKNLNFLECVYIKKYYTCKFTSMNKICDFLLLCLQCSRKFG